MADKKGRGGARRSGAGETHAGSWLMGRNSLQEVVRHCPARVMRIYATQPSVGSIRNLLAALGGRAAGIAIEIATTEQLTRLLGSESHQGCAAQLAERHIGDLDALISSVGGKSRAILVALDSIYDPHNFGSIMRACECLGAHSLIWSKNRGSGITPVVTKASVGASELLMLTRVSNLVTSLSKLKSEGFWIVAADLASGSQDLGSFKFPEKSVLVVGSEGEGISELTRRQADFKVHIKMHGRIGSLNVAQATAILLSKYSGLYA